MRRFRDATGGGAEGRWAGGGMDPGSHPGHLIQLGRRPPAFHRILFLYDLPPFCQSEEIPISRFMPCFADFYFDTPSFPTRQLATARR